MKVLAPCDFEVRESYSVFYFLICSIKGDFFLMSVLTSHVLDRLFHALKRTISPKRVGVKRQVVKNSRVKERKITSFSKTFIKNTFSVLKISTGFFSSQMIYGYRETERQRSFFSLK